MWKSRNFEQWQKTHELLWPGVTLPEVFVPIASNNAAEGDEAKGKGRRVFIEALCTAPMFSHACSANVLQNDRLLSNAANTCRCSMSS